MYMSAVDKRRWTAAQVRAIPYDGRRYEVIEGELLVSRAPSWPHQLAVGFLYRALHAYVSSTQRGQVLFAPADIERDARTMVQPDVFVVPLVNGEVPRSWHEVGCAHLVVEVLSPATRRFDRGVKRRLYRELGAEYWIVDLNARRLERWKPGTSRPELSLGTVEWRAPEADSSLAISLQELFEEALGQ